jgi:hypothetical protein
LIAKELHVRILTGLRCFWKTSKRISIRAAELAVNAYYLGKPLFSASHGSLQQRQAVTNSVFGPRCCHPEFGRR